MDQPYRNAVAQRDKAIEQIRRLKQRLNVAQEQLAVAENFIKGWEIFSGSFTGSSSDEPLPNVEQPKNPTKESVAEQAIQVIRENGRPMSRAEVYDALTARGVVIHGKDPRVVLSTMLWRMKAIVPFIPDVGYWPAGDPLPDADDSSKGPVGGGIFAGIKL